MLERDTGLELSRVTLDGWMMKSGELLIPIAGAAGEAALLETTQSQMSGVVTETTLRELPLNGRDLFQLTELQTGVLPTTNAGPSPWSEGGIIKAAVQGARPLATGFPPKQVVGRLHR